MSHDDHVRRIPYMGPLPEASDGGSVELPPNQRLWMRWELLDRFLRDACDDAERAEVERWAAESPRHRQALDELIEAIRPARDAESAGGEWKRLLRAMGMGDGSGDDEKPDSP